MTGSRHIEILGSLLDGTKVPKANSSSECDGYHARTMGSNGGCHDTGGVSLCAEGGVNLNQESPRRDLFYET